AFSKLQEWKARGNPKPLLIQGARQVGKTRLMREFGRRSFEEMAYVNFEQNSQAVRIFDGDISPGNLLEKLEIETAIKLGTRTSLLILDEIQECPHALKALKYFSEEMPGFPILAAGSLLGVALRHQKISFPVGKVEFLTIHPLTFNEFLLALGEGALLQKIKELNFPFIRTFREKLENLLRTYFYVGGMPEAVSLFSQTRDHGRVRSVQLDLLRAFQADFSKHIPSYSIPKLGLIWRSIPARIANGNGRFFWGELGKGARARDFEDALEWIRECGLVYRVNRIGKPDVPLMSYEDGNAFKLFFLDTGLLCAMAGLDGRSLIVGNKIFKEFKGALTEQFVLQQLIAMCEEHHVCYWEGRTAEVDFLLQLGGDVVPIEVKSAMNLRAKSLGVYCEKYEPKFAVRTSLADFKTVGNLIDIPLYCIEQIVKILADAKSVITTNKPSK
ncbi:MAG: DUF4143 domain-containing protein, partial [Puniceicoccales bacterium]|nr:DUF4143 domain-containing protein [Puniceicoccales bacterium]